MADNSLFCGDNLTVMREHARDQIKDESVDILNLTPGAEGYR